MAKTGYIDITQEQEELYFSPLRPGDRFIVPRVSRKVALMSIRRKLGVTQRSLLPACAALWASFSAGEKSSWATAGTYCSLSGWKLFVRDQCYRIKNDLAGVATPSNIHQALVGQLQVDAPADELKIFQPHPYEYYISHKIAGHKGMYSPLLISERLVLPLVIGLSYKADLIVIAGYSAVVGIAVVGIAECGDVDDENYPFCKFYAIVRRLYQGNNIDTLLEINIDLQEDWKTVTATLSSLLGQYTSYSLYLHLYHLTGTLLIDNVKATHSAQNWARDPSCQDIHQDFTRAFYQVPAHWSAITIPDGAFFESVYPV